jgi:hypothetical protein
VTRQPAVRRHVRAAMAKLLLDHAQLLRRGVSERTITGHLASLLATSFPGWDVDPEYNRRSIVRNGQEHTEPKRIGRDPSILIPDVVVHHRGTSENLLAIELKRGSDRRSLMDDRWKLRRLKRMGYLNVVLVCIRDDSEPFKATFEWI